MTSFEATYTAGLNYLANFAIAAGVGIIGLAFAIRAILYAKQFISLTDSNRIETSVDRYIREALSDDSASAYDDHEQSY